MSTKGVRLICIESFGPFCSGDNFYCFAVEEDHFVVWSAVPILGQNEFKISSSHKSKFRPY